MRWKEDKGYQALLELASRVPGLEVERESLQAANAQADNVIDEAWARLVLIAGEAGDHHIFDTIARLATQVEELKAVERQLRQDIVQMLEDRHGR